MPVDRATSIIAKIAFRALELRRPVTYSDTDDQVLALEDHFAEAVKACLEAGDWSFASKVDTISVREDPANVDPRLPYAFDLPEDCLILREIINPNVRWRADRLVLRADTDDDLAIRYTMLIGDEELPTAQFNQVAGLQLALLLAPTFLEVQSKVARLQDSYDFALRRALRTDAFTASPAGYNDGSGAIDWAGEATL